MCESPCHAHGQGAIVVDCDTSKEAKGKDKIFCAQNKDVLGKDLEYVIDKDGEIVSQGHDVKVMDSRLAKNPVEHVTGKLKFLPNEVSRKGTCGSLVSYWEISGTLLAPPHLRVLLNPMVPGSALCQYRIGIREAASSLRESLGDNSMDDITITESISV